MFQVWIGPCPGKTDEVLPATCLVNAEQIALGKVTAAKKKKQSLIASIFHGQPGVVVSGFATSSLADQLKDNPLIRII
jgi:hypothetical protein